eukprot:364411-Chlamydomonas_euryale.AAC.5
MAYTSSVDCATSMAMEAAWTSLSVDEAVEYLPALPPPPLWSAGGEVRGRHTTHHSAHQNITPNYTASQPQPPNLYETKHHEHSHPTKHEENRPLLTQANECCGGRAACLMAAHFTLAIYAPHIVVRAMLCKVRKMHYYMHVNPCKTVQMHACNNLHLHAMLFVWSLGKNTTDGKGVGGVSACMCQRACKGGPNAQPSTV